MPLHPQVVALIERAAQAGVRPAYKLSPADARTQLEEMSRVRDKDRTEVGSVENRDIPGPAGSIPVRIYRPEGADEGALPAAVFFHGGGHVLGSLDSHDLVARNLCADANCLVVAVDYRLAPEHKFPAAPEDSFAATKWVAGSAGELGIDPSRIAVIGDSAGGNLAAVVAMMAREAGGPELCYQVLVYPVSDYGCDTPSYSEWAEGAGILTAKGMEWFREHYLRDEADRTDWRAAPLHAADFSGLPPALVITAECDVLYDEGVALAEALKNGGTSVEYRNYPGMMHGFYSFAPVIDDGRAAQRFAAERLRAAFGN
jgi:acetyl esterase